MSDGFIISKESWERMTEEERKWIVFDTLQAMHSQLKLLRRWNKCFSLVGGVIGGAATSLGIKWGGP